MNEPTIEDIRRAADRALFPMQVLEGSKSAASFFCAGYLGQLDSIHVLDAGINDVYLCDLDGVKLDRMRSMYPSDWRFERGDAYRLAEQRLAEGARYDIVIADPWAGHIERLNKTFPLWYALSRRWVLMGVTASWFLDQGGEISPDFFRERIRARHELDVTVESLVWRSDWLGGVYWVVVRKDDPDHGLGHPWDHSDDDTLWWRLRRKLRRLGGG